MDKRVLRDWEKVHGQNRGDIADDTFVVEHWRGVPSTENGDCVTHIYRSHTQESDHMANLGGFDFAIICA